MLIKLGLINSYSSQFPIRVNATCIFCVQHLSLPSYGRPVQILKMVILSVKHLSSSYMMK